MKIITVQDYKKALGRLSDLMFSDPEKDSPDGKELDELANEVMEYEALNESWR